MEECMNTILSIIRKHTSFGFVKMQEEVEIREAIDSYVNHVVLIEKERAYNEGYLAGIRTSQRMQSIN
jgi:hypothetical protein